MKHRTRSLVFSALGALLLSAGAGAQTGVDLTGRWTLSASATVGGDAIVVCDFEGEANVVQSQSQLSGDADLALVGGPTSDCPPEMSAVLDGTFANDSIQMGMLAGGLGTADFQGRIARSLVERPRKEGSGPTLSGSFQVTSGTFVNATGSWSAMPRALRSIDIPTLTPAGLTLLVLILLGTGVLALRRP